MNRLREQIAAGPQLISILSGKGGVGKSVIALNLAERLSSAGLRVLLADLDLSGGNLHILANASSQAGLAAYLNGAQPLESAATPLTDRLHLLAHGEPLVMSAYPDSRTARHFAERLRRDASRFDFVVCDHASGVSDFATAVAGVSDVNLLVAVPELTSISDCYGLWKYLRQLDRSINGRLLVNRAQNAPEAEYVAHRLGAVAEQFVGRALGLIGFLPEDKSLRLAVAAQSPVAQVKPESIVVQKLNDIARLLTGGLEPTGAVAFNQTINVNAAPADIKG